QKLSDWLPTRTDSTLFLFHKPGRDRIIANWFIAAEKNNNLLQRLYDSLILYWDQNDFRNFDRQKKSNIEYWSKRIINGRSLALSQIWLSSFFTKALRLYPYMVYHFMFYKLIRTEPACRQIYDQMVKISAQGPHILQREGLLEPLSQEAKLAIDKRKYPLFKLKWKLDSTDIPKGSNLDYLLHR
ncbi:MAG: hypothetical protein KDJ52_34190, partial [Anaerolineae bacterium]|nr:hypothetical protein [Anaerolineae bacterium]